MLKIANPQLFVLSLIEIDWIITKKTPTEINQQAF